MVSEQLICPFCKKTFNKKRHGEKYCSKSCKLRIKDTPYKAFRKDRCEFCGFIPVHICQLDVDHIDGNHKNNDPANLQTLCANCHRLKSLLSRDWEVK